MTLLGWDSMLYQSINRGEGGARNENAGERGLGLGTFGSCAV